jgi:hypothetical protein
MVSVRMTPVCAKSASTAESSRASAPVCELAAREPPAVRPLFTATIGFSLEMRRARLMNFCGLPNDSRYRRMTSVSGSVSHHSMRSLPEMSALLPTETKLRTPIPSSFA